MPVATANALPFSLGFPPSSEAAGNGSAKTRDVAPLRKIMFHPESTVTVEPLSPFQGPCPAGKVRIRNRYSLVSAGTELACLAGVNPWFVLPKCPGYAAMGEVTAIGEGVTSWAVGDGVFHAGPHGSQREVPANELMVKIPAGLDARTVPFLQLADIAFSALRACPGEAGDTVAVIGLGLVGNLAAQLARMAGAFVLGLDTRQDRVDAARACGLAAEVLPKGASSAELIKRWNGGKGVDRVLDATGISPAILAAMDGVVDHGHLVLLGTPRAAHEADVTPLLGACHRRGVTIHGAHVAHKPDQPAAFITHSKRRNMEILLRALSERRITFEPLLGPVAKPEEAPVIYGQLAKGDAGALGVVFDWR